MKRSEFIKSIFAIPAAIKAAIAVSSNTEESRNLGKVIATDGKNIQLLDLENGFLEGQRKDTENHLIATGKEPRYLIIYDPVSSSTGTSFAYCKVTGSII